ncbi:hypothetical protein KI659_17310 [Litoribacter alkaliphilus]|uniref:Peptidase MA-like domain-containing protein n=1 Tax=Litoribacter ruber TaxID=702568 RepID=A0AAP2CKF6_9BACT|nr:hypothetical protein [Litoribacter alkaliphilus]MBS9525782.1 hypothetical protein [Litoribacter alkaliphilus]
MNKIISILVTLLLLVSNQSFGQKIKPTLSARVDTTKTEIKEVYNLFESYLNSNPSRAYENPNWNPEEYSTYLKGKDSKLDKAAYFLYMGMEDTTFFKHSNPFVLQIDSLDHNLYQIKTLFSFEEPKKEVIGITTHHARRNEIGRFKLENSIHYITKDWARYEQEFISYVVEPNIEFNPEEALEAVEFCKKTADLLSLDIEPFTYYITSNTNELGKLYNFDYWLFRITGLSNIYLREVYSAHSNTNYPHEFVHILLPLREVGYAPRIVVEGIATWLGGPIHGQTLEEGLVEVKRDLEKFDDVTFEKILNQEIRNEFDSNILYVTGAVLIQQAFELKGRDAVMALYFSDEKTLKETMEEVFEMAFEEIGKMVMKNIMNKPLS